MYLLKAFLFSSAAMSALSLKLRDVSENNHALIAADTDSQDIPQVRHAFAEFEAPLEPDYQGKADMIRKFFFPIDFCRPSSPSRLTIGP